MPESPVTIESIVQGNRIAIDAPPGFTDGQVVSITVRPVTPTSSGGEHALSPGILAAFGILSEAESAGLDKTVEELRQLRKLERKDQFE